MLEVQHVEQLAKDGSSSSSSSERERSSSTPTTVAYYLTFKNDNMFLKIRRHFNDGKKGIYTMLAHD